MGKRIKAQNSPIKIWVCMAKDSSYHQEVYTHFRAHMNEITGSAFDYEVVAGPIDSIEVFASKLHDSVLNDAKFVVCIGSVITKYLIDIFRSSASRPYIVAIDVEEDEEGKYEAGKGWVTLVSVAQERVLSRRGQIILFLQQSIKRVGIVYYAGSGPNIYLQKQLKEVRLFLMGNGIEACFIGVPSLGRLKAKVMESIRSLDALFTLEGDACSAEYELLISLCNQHKVTFFYSELAAARHGAAVSYGIDTSLLARESALIMAGLAKDNNEAPFELVIENTKSRKVIVNTAACMRQGLALSRAVEMVLKEAKGFEDIRSVGPLVRESFI
jgi:hypothetical protein